MHISSLLHLMGLLCLFFNSALAHAAQPGPYRMVTLQDLLPKDWHGRLIRITPRDELLVTAWAPTVPNSPWGAGILKLDGTLTLLPNNVPGTRDNRSAIFDMNSSGQMVGYNHDWNRIYPALWASPLTSYTLLSNFLGRAVRINNTGEIAGSYDLGVSGFFISGSTKRVLRAPRLATKNIITGINDSGTVVGFSVDQQEKSIALLWNPRDSSDPILLSPLSSYSSSRARMITHSGVAYGTSFEQLTYENDDFGLTKATPTFWKDSTAYALPLLPGFFSGGAWSANAQGTAVGFSSRTGEDSKVLSVGVIWDKGIPFDLNWLVTNVGPLRIAGALQITESGLIHAMALNSNNGIVHVLLIPVERKAVY